MNTLSSVNLLIYFVVQMTKRLLFAKNRSSCRIHTAFKHNNVASNKLHNVNAILRHWQYRGVMDITDDGCWPFFDLTIRGSMGLPETFNAYPLVLLPVLSVRLRWRRWQRLQRIAYSMHSYLHANIIPIQEQSFLSLLSQFYLYHTHY